MTQLDRLLKEGPSIRLPRGFKGARAEASIKRAGRADMILVSADQPAKSAAVFTRNKFVAAPVIWCRECLAQRNEFRAIVANAGNANAGTGEKGDQDARAMAVAVAAGLSCDPHEVFVSSTGVIGRPLPMDKISAGISSLLEAQNTEVRIDDLAKAIMTTDSVPKWGSRKSGGSVITGIVKGAGMIHPDMATMLCYIFTDAAVDAEALQSAVTKIVNKSFNAISIDNDTSTNDTLIVMASGAAGEPGDDFESQLGDLCLELALKCVADGEGATKLVTIEISEAASEEEAKLAADAVATSMLVKTAVHGADPNWGRILAAVGRCGVMIDTKKSRIHLQDQLLYAEGLPASTDLSEVERRMKEKNVVIKVSLGAGSSSWTAYTSDLSEEYVSINADYTT